MKTTEELAKQAGVDIMQHEWQWSYKWPASLEALEKFRELAVAEERERCAALCRRVADETRNSEDARAAGRMLANWISTGNPNDPGA